MGANTFAPLLSTFLVVMASGCAGTALGNVAIRPDGTPGPEKCSEEARKAMNYLQMFVGESAWMDIDANQAMTSPITIYEGPIESILSENLGLLESPARLYGRVWTGGPQVVIRYYEAQPVRGGHSIPICAVARLSKGQLKKLPSSKPGTAILEFSRAGVYIVDGFR